MAALRAVAGTLVLLLLLRAADADADVLVTTALGTIRGVETKDGTWIFRGIPYAQPPTGDRRWRGPAAPLAWEGVLNATSFGAPCYPSGKSMLPDIMEPNEDCLFLNIWVPRSAREASTRQPVVVMLHGGGFVLGSAGNEMVSPNPEQLVNTTGLVYVSLNYRLGPFGFLAHPALDGPDAKSGALGIRDQLCVFLLTLLFADTFCYSAALQWVQRHIGNFYGDASEVTLMGESAGAFSICLLLSTPASRGLFHRAIMSSVLCNYPFPTREEGHAQGTLLSHAIGCENGTAAEVAECLRSASPSAVLEALKPRRGLLFYDGYTWFPVIDDSLMHADGPMAAFRSPGYVDESVRVVLGANEDEGSIFVMLGYPIYLDSVHVSEMLGAMFGQEGVEQLHALNAAERKFLSARDYASHVFSQMWHCLTRGSADAIAESLPGQVFVYHYSHRTEGLSWPFSGLGSFHGSELGIWSGRDAKPEHPLNGHVMRQFQALFHSFARGGAPESLPDHGEWRPFMPQSDPYVHPFWSENSCNRTTCHVPIVPSYERCPLWDSFLDERGLMRNLPGDFPEAPLSKFLNESMLMYLAKASAMTVIMTMGAFFGSISVFLKYRKNRKAKKAEKAVDAKKDD